MTKYYLSFIKYNMWSPFQCIIAIDSFEDLIGQLEDLDINYPCTILVWENNKVDDKKVYDLYFNWSD